MVAAARRVKASGRKIGVRSGGHSFPGASLVEDGILDVRNSNRKITYDGETKIIGPGVLDQECSMFLRKHGSLLRSPWRGFCLADGQGWSMRDCDITSDT